MLSQYRITKESLTDNSSGIYKDLYLENFPAHLNFYKKLYLEINLSYYLVSI